MNYINYYKEGSRIHIKKSHEGRFTEYCKGKVTRECIRRGKSSPDPKVRKQATFAENARTWKHQYGGFFSAVANPYKTTVVIEDPRQGKEEKSETAPVDTVETSGNWYDSLIKSLGGEDTSSQPAESQSSSTESTLSSSQYKNGETEKFKTELYKELESRGFGGETGKTLVALMGLETRHGQAVPGDFNYGNITAGTSWHGRTSTAKDNLNGRNYTFRAYDNLSLGILDYLRLILVYDIKPGDSKETVTAKLTGLNHGGRKWAEASHYASAIDNVYKLYWG